MKRLEDWTIEYAILHSSLRKHSNLMLTISNFLNKYLWFSGFLFLFSLGQLQRIQLTNSIAVYSHEIFAFIWMMKNSKKYFHWLKYLLKNTEFVKKNFAFISFILYLSFQLVCYNILDFQLTQIVYHLRFLFYTFFLFFLFFQHRTRKLSANAFKLAIAFIGIFIATLGLIQYFTIPDSRFLIYSGWDDHYYRLISSLFDPGFTAIILVMTFLALFSWQGRFSNIFSFLIQTLFLGTILLTYSRAGYLSLLVGFIMISITLVHKKTKRWKLSNIFALSVFFVVLIPFLPKPGGEGVNLLRTTSIQQRIESNQTAIHSLTWKTIVFGSGFYRAIEVKDSVPNHATAPDNSYIFIFTSMGIVGSILFLLTVYQYKNRIFSHHTFLIVGSALCVNSLFNNSLFYV